MARIITVKIAVPDDYDAEPMLHRLDETLTAIQGEPSEVEEVPDDVRCAELEFTYWGHHVDRSIQDVVDSDEWQGGEA